MLFSPFHGNATFAFLTPGHQKNLGFIHLNYLGLHYLGFMQFEFLHKSVGQRTPVVYCAAATLQTSSQSLAGDQLGPHAALLRSKMKKKNTFHKTLIIHSFDHQSFDHQFFPDHMFSVSAGAGFCAAKAAPITAAITVGTHRCSGADAFRALCGENHHPKPGRPFGSWRAGYTGEK